MNSLNLISSRVISQATSLSRPRSRSQGEALTSKQSEELLRGRSYSDDSLAKFKKEDTSTTSESPESDTLSDDGHEHAGDADHEKTPLLSTDNKDEAMVYQSRLRRLVKRIADALTALLTTIGAPIVYAVQCFQDDDGGGYSPLIPFKRVRRRLNSRAVSKSTSAAVGLTNAPATELWDEKPQKKLPQDGRLKHSYSSDSLRSTTSESESDKKRSKWKKDTKKSSLTVEEPPSRRQSIRIKLHNEESLKSTKSKQRGATSGASPPLTLDTIKSPTSTSTSMKPTRYPHAPKAPRPLTPRRQPSYSNLLSRNPSLRSVPPNQQQKTLVLDLDETLIHSLAKGGRLSKGYMVEVKLNSPVQLSPTLNGQQPPFLGPQHPILYYVHKRPHCDEFLRKICKWYKLVIFTASVQEYADPVIDLLEVERKYFSARYYRQHCTYRSGAYIKDLSSVEPDLSKVMILDNSPLSYLFHEDNAIPIEGWINDPTDNDLMHLIPMFEALQYATDVRAVLALRRGEAQAL